MEKTDVIFRWWADGGVYALFPVLPGTPNPAMCLCYQHVGQHSSAHLAGCIQNSRPATAAEYAELEKELRQIGYDVRIVQRATKWHRAAREAQLR